jgi:hypothetical protein
VPNKIPVRIAGLLTFAILILVAVLSIVMQMLVLNGASQSQGFNAMSISLICQGVGLFPAIILTRWLTNFLITKYNWKNIPAILVAVAAGTTLGGITSFLSIIISTLEAGIR